MLRILLLVCVAMLSQLPAISHAQTAYLQSSQVFSGDIAELMIEFDNRIPSLYALDTSALEADFEVLDIKSSVSRMLESNKVFHRMRWQIDILPRQSGKLRIPSLRVGEVFTPVLTLEVVPQSPELNSASHVHVELESESDNPYMGQQAQVVIRVIHNIPLLDGHLIEPTVENADVYSQGLESRYSIFRDGREFQVLERNLSLVAKSPGKIVVSPAHFRGLIYSTPGTKSTIKPRRISRSSQALLLEARKPPTEFSGNTWLPARELELEQHWDEISNGLKVGDSLGLTLGIEARGLPAEALPADLLAIDFGKARVYADQETRSNRFDGRELAGRLQQRFVFVVTEPGEIQIPAISLKWWDIEQEIERIASLAGKTWKVSTSGNGNAGIDTAEQTTGSYGTGLPALVITLARSNHWPWYLVIGAVLLISGLLVSARSVRIHISESIAAMLARRRNRRLLEQACISNNPVLAFRALVAWGRARWPLDNINSLYQIRIRTGSKELVGELHRLDRALYADQGTPWQGQQLWPLVAREHRHSQAETGIRKDSLPELYPQRS